MSFLRFLPPFNPDCNSDDNSNNECHICMCNPKTHAFIPCLHQCVCERCGNTIMNPEDGATPRCIICRQRITGCQQVYNT